MGLALVLGVVGCGDDGGTGAAASAGSTAGPGSSTEASATDSTATSDVTVGADTSTGAEALPCNGHVELCDRPFDTVAFPGTHNSHAAIDDGFPQVNANQQHGIAQQLDVGIRVLLIDIYPDQSDPDAIVMCHGPCSLASTPHIEGLGAITDFLLANPREVITIIYQDDVAVEELVEDYVTTGADALVFTHAPGSPWPTLGEMIDANTRLVVTLESAGPPPAWLHHVWDEAWDTPYGPTTIEELSCDLNRGSTDNALFLVNHWVNDALGLPSEDNAAMVNTTEVLGARAHECWRRWGHIPNFVVVDFHEQGDLLAVVDELNGV